MKPTTLNDFIGRMVEIGLVAQSQPIITSQLGHGRTLVEVGDTSRTSSYVPEYENSLKHYVDTFNEGKYSLLLFDGSMIFIKYHFDKSKPNMRWHRYVFLPAIAAIDIFAGDGPGELPSADEYISVARRASLRFEYAPDEVADNHPASHLHLNSGSCRIPVSSRLGVVEFMHFVVGSFYPDLYTKFHDSMPIAMQFSDDLAISDRARFRVAVPQI